VIVDVGVDVDVLVLVNVDGLGEFGCDQAPFEGPITLKTQAPPR
jgi:hypothetical protein